MRIFLAPMEGVVDHHLRYILSQLGGIDICVTEFVRVTHHVLPEKVFKRYSPELLAATPSSHNLHLTHQPTRVQLLGSEPELLARNAAKVAKMGAPGIDLNFGCPAKVVNKNRGGACLLQEPETIFNIIKAVRNAVPNNIPVSAKIRLGYNDRSGYIENATAINEAGANELVVHARSKVDGYRPPAYWELIADIRQAIPIPVIANGEIWTEENFLQCQQDSGCQDFMLGRGLLARPDLALAIKAIASQKIHQPVPWPTIADQLLHFFELTTAAYPAKFLGNRTKQWLFYLQRQYPEAQKLFEKIKRSREYRTIKKAILDSKASSKQLDIISDVG